MTARSVGVLVMAHGTPAAPEEIGPFYTRIRRGSPPSAAQLADLCRRYEAIGGTSPLAARTEAQVAGVARELERLEPGRFTVRFGAKHMAPFIEDAASALARETDTVVAIVLAPHRASMGSDEYLERAAAAVEATGERTGLVAVRQWWDAPGFAELMAGRLREAIAGVHADGPPTVLFTAHSLPERVVAAGDPYPEQVAASGDAVAAAAGLARAGIPWRVAWQSAGRTPEPWIGPDLLATLRDLAQQGVRAVVVCPIGFAADHLEVLYDLDIEARQVADTVGVSLVRTRSLNDDPRLCTILANVLREAAARSSFAPGASGRSSTRFTRFGDR